VEQGEKESLRFLRDTLPHVDVPQRSIALERCETIVRRLIQAHLDNGRRTYATGAYYCALLGEIAAHEGRLSTFKLWYEKYMAGYKRFRAVRAEMDMRVGPVLRGRLADR